MQKWGKIIQIFYTEVRKYFLSSSPCLPDAIIYQKKVSEENEMWSWKSLNEILSSFLSLSLIFSSQMCANKAKEET